MSQSSEWLCALEAWQRGDQPVLVLTSAASAGAVAEQLERYELQPVLIDFTPISDKAALMAAMRGALNLDEWFGANWDALADALHGPEGPVAGQTVLFLCLPPGGPALPQADFATLLDIIEDAAESERSTLKGAVVLGGSPFARWGTAR